MCVSYQLLNNKSPQTQHPKTTSSHCISFCGLGQEHSAVGSSFLSPVTPALWSSRGSAEGMSASHGQEWTQSLVPVGWNLSASALTCLRIPRWHGFLGAGGFRVKTQSTSSSITATVSPTATGPRAAAWGRCPRESLSQHWGYELTVPDAQTSTSLAFNIDFLSSGTSVMSHHQTE